MVAFVNRTALEKRDPAPWSAPTSLAVSSNRLDCSGSSGLCSGLLFMKSTYDHLKEMSAALRIS
jgi:hypothetical protein